MVSWKVITAIYNMNKTFNNHKVKENFSIGNSVITARSNIFSKLKHIMPVFVIFPPWGRTISHDFLVIQRTRSNMFWRCSWRFNASDISSVMSTKYTYLNLHTAIHPCSANVNISKHLPPIRIPGSVLKYIQSFITHI